MEDQPKIYVLTRAYNAERTIRRTIESVLNQSYRNFSYVIRDNGSTDGTYAICQEYAQRDSRITLVRNGTNNTVVTEEDGAAVQLEFSLRHGTALGENDFFCLLDADDEYLPHFFERAVSFAQNERLDIVVGDTEIVEERTGNVIAARMQDADWVLEGCGFSDCFPEYHWNLRQVWGKLYRGHVLLDFPNYWQNLKKGLLSDPDAVLSYGVDTIAALYHFQKARRVGFLSGVQHRYYVQEKSVSTSLAPTRIEADTILYNAAEVFLLQKAGTVTPQNRQFLLDTGAHAILDTLKLITNTQLTAEQYLSAVEKVMEQPLTRSVLRAETQYTPLLKHTILDLALELGASGPQLADRAHIILKTTAPRCGYIVTAPYIPLFEANKLLRDALKNDDPDTILDRLLELIRKQKYTARYDLGALVCSLAVDHKLLCQIKDTAFLREYGDIYREIFYGDTFSALDQMTGLLLDGKVTSGAETFLQLYVSLAAKLEQPAAFVFGKLRLADLYWEQDRHSECRALVRELEEMGLTDNEELAELRERLDRSPDMEKETLWRESDFSAYIDLLKRGLDRYMIIIAANDTPWADDFTPELTRKLCSLGPRNLYGKYRYAYYAVIDRGVVKREQLGATKLDVLRYKGYVGGISLEIESAGWETGRRHAKIAINGRDCSLNRRGLNFVVLDRTDNTVIDHVCFDTFNKMQCARLEQLLLGLKKWRKAHPDVTVIFLKSWIPFPETGLTPEQEYIKKYIPDYHQIGKHIYDPDLPHLAFFDRLEDVLESIIPPISYHDASGIRHFEDTRGRVVNTVGGHRLTTDQPEQSERTIYLTGTCSIFGIGAADRDTIASWLQRALNEHAPEEKLIVQNYGYYLETGDRTGIDEEVTILSSLPVQPGDIVVIDWIDQLNLLELPDLPFADLTPAREDEQKYGLMQADMVVHLTPNGYHLVADRIFELLKKEDFFRSAGQSPAEPAQPPAGPFKRDPAPIEELAEYKEQLSRLYDERFSVGSIVMNCNPFTLGHRYLIEQASRQCGHLVVFVVEDDLSEFPFRDRLQMVKDGTADLGSVTVLPSGQFILSSLTFSEYFNKSELQDRVIDASKDVTIFGAEIAPCLHITKRFVGEEPSDTVTRQYNNDMKTILPQYGVEVIEIERLKRADGTPVSASDVRACIRAGDLDALSELVPQTTSAYLSAHAELLKMDRLSRGG